MRLLISFLLIGALVCNPLSISALGGKAFASDNPMGDAVTFIIAVPIALFVIGVGLAAIQTLIYRTAGRPIHGQNQPSPYIGWIRAVSTNSLEANAGDEITIVNEGYLYREPLPPGESLVWLEKDRHAKVIEARKVAGNPWFYRSFNGDWYKVETQD